MTFSNDDPKHDRKSQKQKIRADALKLRDTFEKNPDDPDLIAQRFLSLFEDIKGKVISVYWPIKSEIDTSPLIEKLLKKGATVALPVTGKRLEPLKFVKWDGVEPLQKSGFGTYAPKQTQDNTIIPNIIVLPLVAFDRYGTRLGYGQGHYDITLDKFLAEGIDIKTVGYAYDQQICLFPLPKEDHDQKLDVILTPTQTY